MNTDNIDRPVIAPGALEESPTPSATRRRSLREIEYRFFVDPRGRQHFNFKQSLWLDPSVDMAFTRVYSTALKTLAANMLTLALAMPARSVVELAAPFSRECLMGAPDKAWVLPKSTIEDWYESRLRRMRRPRSAHSGRPGTAGKRRKAGPR